MNIRIEQGASATPPTGRPRRSLPRGLAEARRRAAQVLLRTSDESTTTRPPLTLVRRSGSCLAMAVAALAVPTLSSPAFGATALPAMSQPATSQPATSQTAAPTAPAPLVRHHIPHDLVFPGPGAVGYQTWAAGSESRTADTDHSAWATASTWWLGATEPLTDIAPPMNTALVMNAAPEVDPRCLTFPHHRPCVPWRFHNGAPMRSSDPIADTTRPMIEAARIPHANLRAIGEPDTPEPDGKPAGEDTSPSTVPASDFPRPEPSTGQPTDESNAPAARTRIVPLALMAAPATTAPGSAPLSAQAPGAPASALKPNRLAKAVAKPLASPCLRAAYLVGKDHRMLAHLRPATDAMSVIVNHPHASCAAMVDYLSQSRA